MEGCDDMAITITTDCTMIVENAWDFPIEELDYLLEEHDGETFALRDGRLWNAMTGTHTRQ